MNKKLLLSLTPHFGKGPNNLLSVSELESLLNLRPFVNNKRLHLCKENMSFKWPGYVWSTDVNGWPVSRIKEALKHTSMYISDASKANRKINGFSEGLEKVFKSPVDCHIYFSSSVNGKSFKKHKDENHNYIVCVKGKMYCEIWTDKSVISKTMKPGDTAFVPAFVYHRITPLTDKRISCSFPIAHNGKKLYEERKWLRL